MKRLLIKVAPFVAFVLMAAALSAYRARVLCNDAMRSSIPPLPPYKTAFALHPGRHMSGVDQFGLKPGWIVSYAHPSKEEGKAFFVSPFGKLLAEGTPNFVLEQRKQKKAALRKFRDGFSQLDQAVQVGSAFADVVSALGKPLDASTNGDGSFRAIYMYDSPLATGEPVTNGFSLRVSNGVVVWKGYVFGP